MTVQTRAGNWFFVIAGACETPNSLGFVSLLMYVLLGRVILLPCGLCGLDSGPPCHMPSHLAGAALQYPLSVHHGTVIAVSSVDSQLVTVTVAVT